MPRPPPLETPRPAPLAHRVAGAGGPRYPALTPASTALPLTVDRIHDFFPTASSLSPQNGNGMQVVKDASGITLG